MSATTMNDDDAVGYRRPPASTRFRKGRSGNEKGRPPNRRRALPYDAVLGQKVTIREDGRERREDADKAFLLYLTKKGLQGDTATARDLLASLEAARARRGPADVIEPLRIVFVGKIFASALEPLGLAVKTLRQNKERARWLLKRWIVEAALKRLGPRRLSAEEQRKVWGATHTPDKVRWPDWWTEYRGPAAPGAVWEGVTSSEAPDLQGATSLSGSHTAKRRGTMGTRRGQGRFRPSRL